MRSGSDGGGSDGGDAHGVEEVDDERPSAGVSGRRSRRLPRPVIARFGRFGHPLCVALPNQMKFTSHHRPKTPSFAYGRWRSIELVPVSSDLASLRPAVTPPTLSIGNFIPHISINMTMHCGSKNPIPSPPSLPPSHPPIRTVR